jgi:hypothetical protein
LHFSHIGLTDGRTFTVASLSSPMETNSSRSPALETGSVAATVPQKRSQRVENLARARNERC